MDWIFFFGLGSVCLMRICGVVEGFYGRPWRPQQRQELYATLNALGLNAYLYAPKDDRKHRAFWRDLYTDAELGMVS